MIQFVALPASLLSLYLNNSKSQILIRVQCVNFRFLSFSLAKNFAWLVVQHLRIKSASREK